MKIENELAAHGELIDGLQDDTITLKRRVDDLHDRFVVIEGTVVKLSATIEREVTPLLSQNTEICARVEKKVDKQATKIDVLDTLGGKVDNIVFMLNDFDRQRAERAYRARVGAFLKTTSGIMSSMIAASVGIGGAAVWLINHFFK